MAFEDRQVVPLEHLAGLSRRDLCKGAALGLVALGVPGCVSGDLGGGHGGEGGEGGGGQGGAGGGATDDGGGGGGVGGAPGDGVMPPADAPAADGGGPACGTTAIGTGKKPSDFAMNTATFFSAQKTFICRDGSGLYAMTAVCTHQGTTIKFVPGTVSFDCPNHHSLFNYNGAVTKGPATSALKHYAVCLDGGGSVAFDPKMVVAAATRFIG